MSAPETYLLTTPDIKDDPFGRAISSSDLVRNLRKLNPNIWANEQYDGVWYPGKATGQTCLWLADPGGLSTKLGSFTPGAIPEWTQLDDKGNIIAIGWRQLLKLVIRRADLRALDVERLFHVDLGVDGEDSYCKMCRRGNHRIKATSKGQLCDMHSRVAKNVEKARQMKQDLGYLERKLSCRLSPLKVLRSSEASRRMPM